VKEKTFHNWYINANVRWSSLDTTTTQCTSLCTKSTFMLNVLLNNKPLSSLKRIGKN